MGTIDIKLKSYEELQFEITRLNTDKYLLEQKVKQYKEVIDKAIEYIEKHEEKQIAYNYEYYLEDKEVCDLLNILKGDNK